MKLLTGILTTLSHLRLRSCHYHTALTSRCRFANFTQYAESHNLLFHSMTHCYQHHQSAVFLQKTSYYFRSVSLFSFIDGTSCELSTRTLLVITTFTLEWLTEWNNVRVDGLQSLTLSGFAYYIIHNALLGYLKALKTYLFNHDHTIICVVLHDHAINFEYNNIYFIRDISVDLCSSGISGISTHQQTATAIQVHQLASKLLQSNITTINITTILQLLFSLVNSLFFPTRFPALLICLLDHLQFLMNVHQSRQQSTVLHLPAKDYIFFLNVAEALWKYNCLQQNRKKHSLDNRCFTLSSTELHLSFIAWHTTPKLLPSIKSCCRYVLSVEYVSQQMLKREANDG